MSGAIALEVAEAEFERFAVKMRLDLDPSGLDSDDKKNLADAKRRFLTAMQQGLLIVDDAGQPVFTPEQGEPITFYRPRGATLMAMDVKKAGHDITKGLAAMAEMTKQNIVRYHDMPMPDLRICQAIVALFLG